MPRVGRRLPRVGCRFPLALIACWLWVVGRRLLVIAYRLLVVDNRLSFVARRSSPVARLSSLLVLNLCTVPVCYHAVPVEAADLVALTPPWDARGGKRELLFVSPSGLARYWPDLYTPRRFTDVDARSVAPGQSVRAVWGLEGGSGGSCGGGGGGEGRGEGGEGVMAGIDGGGRRPRSDGKDEVTAG